MTGAVTHLFIAILAAWTIAGLSGYLLPMTVALALGALVGFAALIFPKNPVSRGLIAILDPVGVVLPLLALRHMAGWFGLSGYAFSATELTVFLIVFVLFLAAATDKLPFDPYRLGYSPIPVALVVLAICLIGAVQGSFFLPALAVLAQVLWVLRWGSSNYFDHILHATLVPVVLIELIGRLL